MSKKYSIAIHGGAGVLPRDASQDTIDMWNDSCSAALRAGEDVLKAGGTSVDAVVAAITVMEDDPIFNCGTGAVFSNDGLHELDSSIMNGATFGCGAATGLQRIKNPIQLVRLIMEHSPHVMMIARGAEKFAETQGVELVEQSYFYTEHRYKQWQQSLNEGENITAAIADCMFVDSEPRMKKGTVGCAALDMCGNLAAGTSTGGLTNKKFGRVGDTSIIGAGTYANNATVAVSCTGNGEEFIRYGVAKDVHNLLYYRNMSVQQAADEVIHGGRLRPDDGGLIAVDKDGNIAYACNSDVVFRGGANSDGLFEIFLWMD